MTTLDAAIKEKYNELEKLLRDADKLVSETKGSSAARKTKQQRNAINAACNAMWRAVCA